MQSPVRVTGSVAGGVAVNVTLVIYSDDGSFVANWSDAYQDTGDRVEFDQSLPYAPALAGKGAKIMMTATVLSVAGGPASESTYSVPITLQ